MPLLAGSGPAAIVFTRFFLFLHPLKDFFPFEHARMFSATHTKKTCADNYKFCFNKVLSTSSVCFPWKQKIIGSTVGQIESN